MSDATNAKVRGGDPDPPPVVLSLANGGILPGWAKADEAKWTAEADA